MLSFNMKTVRKIYDNNGKLLRTVTVISNENNKKKLRKKSNKKNAPKKGKSKK